MNHVIKPAIRATPTIPPTIPPTASPTIPPVIAPAFELLFDDGDDAGEDVPGVIVGWLLVELGTLEALPVTSGESVIKR